MSFPLKIIGNIKSKDTLPTDGLVTYYPFNGNANDESGNGYNATVNGATLTADRHGNPDSAYSFITNDNIYRDEDWAALLGTEYTIVLWATINGTNQFIFNMGRLTGSNNSQIRLYHTGGALRYESRDINNISVGIVRPINFGQNYFICMTRNGTNTSLTLDTDLYTAGNPLLSTHSLETMALGSYRNVAGTGWYLDGIIDDVRFYNRELTTEERTQLYNE